MLACSLTEDDVRSAKRGQIPLELSDKLFCSLALPEASGTFQKSESKGSADLGTGPSFVRTRKGYGVGGKDQSAWWS